MLQDTDVVLVLRKKALKCKNTESLYFSRSELRTLVKIGIKRKRRFLKYKSNLRRMMDSVTL